MAHVHGEIVKSGKGANLLFLLDTAKNPARGCCDELHERERVFSPHLPTNTAHAVKIFYKSDAVSKSKIYYS